MTTDLSSPIERVEKATGPSIHLETEIAIALRYGQEMYPGRPLGSFRDGYVQADLGRDGWSVGWKVPQFTASLDAALALVERVLPGWGWEAVRPLGGGGYAKVFDGTGREFDRTGEIGALSEWLDAGPCHSPTPAIALILALLRALQAQGNTDDR